MSDITIETAEGTWTVRAGGAVIAETTDALRLAESGHAPVIYFPRGDIAMMFLEASNTRTTCPLKGEASYFSVQTNSELIRDVAWSYESPKDAAAQIAGRVAFLADRVTVEEI